jgi:hypothetical protein
MEDDDETPKDEIETPAYDPKMDRMKRETAS